MAKGATLALSTSDIVGFSVAIQQRLCYVHRIWLSIISYSFTMTTSALLEAGANLSTWPTTERSLSTDLPPICQYFVFFLYGLVAGTVCIIGLVGNLISVVVLRLDSKTPVASFQLMALAVADNLLLALWFIHYCLRYVLRFFGSENPPALIFVRVHTFPVLYTAQTWTIWLTVLIAFTRYVAVCWPYHAFHFHNVNTVRIQIALVTVFSIIYNLPR